jgi:hypothetical protein
MVKMRVRERVAVLIRRRRHVLLVSDACCGGLGGGGDQTGEMRRNLGGGLRPVVPVQSAAPWVRYRAALAPEDGTHPNHGGRNMGKAPEHLCDACLLLEAAQHDRYPALA